MTLGRWVSLLASQISPASPPQISSNNVVARSIALRANSKSTPRSKRCDASVCKPYCLARPAIANGEKNADSKITSFVSLFTPLAAPPKIPAIAKGPFWSAINKVFD